MLKRRKVGRGACWFYHLCTVYWRDVILMVLVLVLIFNVEGDVVLSTVHSLCAIILISQQGSASRNLMADSRESN